MTYQRGRPPKLTRAQIRRILTWHARWLRFRARHGTLQVLARRLNVRQHVITSCIEGYRKSYLPRGSTPALRTASRRGRPRVLHDGDIRVVIAWHLKYQRFYLRHGSAKSLALKLGVSESTVYDCIRRRGRYRQRFEPEMTAAETSRQVMKAPAATLRQRADHEETRWRATLLKHWHRSRT